MRILRIFVSAIILISLIAAVSCSSYSQSDDAFVAGETLTPERLDELSRQLTAQSTSEEEITTVVEIKFSYDGECYWVKGSEVFHISGDCRYIKNSKNVNQGDAYSAAADGCERMCSSCQKQVEAATEDTTEN
ncbi:MAG: hypothetical protein E7589_00725 [Ruminococcaceae bacterium]|nr:hypothetical protein [Oscillospiraceae bacterium]MBE6902874.1 hypothetical protein [Oscillospiraceae bacterium]